MKAGIRTIAAAGHVYRVETGDLAVVLTCPCGRTLRIGSFYGLVPWRHEECPCGRRHVASIDLNIYARRLRPGEEAR